MGKTFAVLLAWLYALTADAAGGGNRKVALRLHVVVDRRVVVDDAHRCACDLAVMLDEAVEGPLADLASILRSRFGLGPDEPVLEVRGWRGGLSPALAQHPRTRARPAGASGPLVMGCSRLVFRGHQPAAGRRGLQDSRAATHAHPLLAGHAARLLFDKQQLDAARCAELLAQNLSAANPSERAAYWLEGYLYPSGTVLLLHDPLWHILDDWLRALTPEHFTELLPLLRRTFGSFEPGERRQLGDKAREHAGDRPATTSPARVADNTDHHSDHALAALQTVAAWLDVPHLHTP